MLGECFYHQRQIPRARGALNNGIAGETADEAAVGIIRFLRVGNRRTFLQRPLQQRQPRGGQIVRALTDRQLLQIDIAGYFYNRTEIRKIIGKVQRQNDSFLFAYFQLDVLQNFLARGVETCFVNP